MSEHMSEVITAYVARTQENTSTVERWAEIIKGDYLPDNPTDPRDHLAVLVRDFRVLKSGLNHGRWYRDERREWRRTHLDLYEFMVKVADVSVGS